MQTPLDDFYLGRFVLQKKRVPREALLECLFQLSQDRKSGTARPLGVLLVNQGLLSPQELDSILSARVSEEGPAAKFSEAEIGKLLVAAGLLSKENVEECLGLQEGMRRSGKQPPPLGELVVERGYVTEPQVMRVLAYQKKNLFACSGCGLRATLAPPSAGLRYRCKKCGGVLSPVESPGGSPAAGAETVALREAERGEDEQFEIDRAVAVYLKQKNLARRDQMREAQRLQIEFARYGLVVPLLKLMHRMGAFSRQQEQDLEAMDFGKVVKDPSWKAQVIPGYLLHSRVASGGFAGIWTAQAQFGSGRVAVKILHPERAKDPRSVSRFEWEAMLARRFNSPHIVRGIDYGFERGHHYLVMEYVEGRSLGQMLSDGGPFPVREAIRVTRQVALALRYLHAEGYLHRDVKPDNVLLDEKGAAKLCDLGFTIPIPKHEPEGQRSLTAVGTAGYMSPEVARGESDVKVGADIYSLGILLYALLTGHEPFAGASSEEVVTDQLESGMPVPNLMMVQAPASVVQTLKRAMHPDRRKRFSSMVDVLGALDQVRVE